MTELCDGLTTRPLTTDDAQAVFEVIAAFTLGRKELPRKNNHQRDREEACREEACRRRADVLRPTRHQQRANRSHQRPPGTLARQRTPTSATSPTTSPDPCWKPAASDPTYTLDREEPDYLSGTLPDRRQLRRQGPRQPRHRAAAGKTADRPRRRPRHQGVPRRGTHFSQRP